MAATAVAASAQAIKTPSHAFVVPAARDAAQAADRVVNDWTVSAFDGKIGAIKDAGQDHQKLNLEQLIAFYKQAPAAIAELNAAILKCHENSGILTWIPLLSQPNEVLTAKRAPQFELLRLTQKAEERTKAAKADAEALRTKVRTVEATQQTLAAKVADLAKGLGTACGNYVHSKGGYSSVGIGTTYSLYSNDAAIQHYEETQAKEKQAAAKAAAAKPEATKAPEKQSPAVAAVPPQIEPNWKHQFLIDLTSAYGAAIDTPHVKLSIEDQTKRATKLPAVEAAEKAKGLEREKAIASDVNLWITWEQENRRANNVIDNMRRAVEACDIALSPLSATRADVLKDLDLMTDFNAAIARVKADKAELERRIAKLSKLQETVNPEVIQFGDLVGKKCLSLLYEKGKVWYYTSYAAAIDQFKQEYMTEKKPETATVVPATAAAPTAAATATTATTAAAAAQPTAAAPVAAAAQAKTPVHLNFDPSKELSVLQKHVDKLGGKHQNLNIAILDGTPVTPAEQSACEALATEVGTYLLNHNPARLPSPVVVPQAYSERWRQANSLVEGINTMLGTLLNTDSKHSKK